LLGLIGLMAGVPDCTDEIRVGSFSGAFVADGAAAGGGGAAGADAGPGCTPKYCQSHLYNCGDCFDNDSDTLIDSDDPDCLGPCQNNEDSFFTSIPGGTSDKCTQDCYFDQDTGPGNDECLWSRICDPLEVEPAYDPSGVDCAFDPTITLQQLGGPRSCTDLDQSQAAGCGTFCGPLTPNGCDCFGCCAIEGGATPVWIGSTDDQGNPTCDLSTAADATRCRPCTQVASCLNPCDHCELCIGKPVPPADCSSDSGTTGQCPNGLPACGLPGQAPCDAGSYCITGCCVVLVY
jgi:hypothetical protein